MEDSRFSTSKMQRTLTPHQGFHARRTLTPSNLTSDFPYGGGPDPRYSGPDLRSSAASIDAGGRPSRNHLAAVDAQQINRHSAHSSAASDSGLLPPSYRPTATSMASLASLTGHSPAVKGLFSFKNKMAGAS